MTDLVYMLILYKDWPQARRLIDRLDGRNVSFVIHVDQKIDDSFVAEAQAYLIDRPNCSFLDRRKVHWGGWGLVQVLLDGARHVEARGIPCDAYIYMSGQDYPLLSSEKVTAYFAGREGKQFLENFSLPYENWHNGGLDRVKPFHFEIGSRHIMYPPPPESLPRRARPLAAWLPMIDRRLPGRYRYYGGSAAIILDRAGVSYLNSFLSTRLGHQILRYFELTRHPDELFFQTVFMNSPLRDTVINDELRYSDWSSPGQPHPKTLRIDDLDRLRASGKLFARKFDAARDSAILDALDSSMR